MAHSHIPTFPHSHIKHKTYTLHTKTRLHSSHTTLLPEYFYQRDMRSTATGSTPITTHKQLLPACTRVLLHAHHTPPCACYAAAHACALPTATDVFSRRPRAIGTDAQLQQACCGLRLGLRPRREAAPIFSWMRYFI